MKKAYISSHDVALATLSLSVLCTRDMYTYISIRETHLDEHDINGSEYYQAKSQSGNGEKARLEVILPLHSIGKREHRAEKRSRRTSIHSPQLWSPIAVYATVRSSLRGTHIHISAGVL